MTDEGLCRVGWSTSVATLDIGESVSYRQQLLRHLLAWLLSDEDTGLRAVFSILWHMEVVDSLVCPFNQSMNRNSFASSPCTQSWDVIVWTSWLFFFLVLVGCRLCLIISPSPPLQVLTNRVLGLEGPAKSHLESSSTHMGRYAVEFRKCLWSPHFLPSFS